MGRRHNKLAWWRRPYEKAAAGEARDGWGESTRDGASNGVGGRGTRSERPRRAGRGARGASGAGRAEWAGHTERSIQMDGRPLHSITVKDSA